MSVKKIYDKENEQVQKNTREAHELFSQAIQEQRERANMPMSDLTIAASVSPAQTYRVLTNPDANISLLTMNRFAAPFGKKVVVSLVDDDEYESGM